LIDKGHLGQLATGHLVARQELRELVTGLALPKIPQAAVV
jgi:chromosome partitioning protein